MNKSIIIAALVILLVGLGGYLVYDKVIDKKQENNSNQEVEEIKEQEFDKEEASRLVSKYSSLFMDQFYSQYAKKDIIITLTEEDKITMTLKTIYNSIQNDDSSVVYEIVTCDKIAGTEVLENIGCKINNEYEFDYNTISITYNEVNKMYKKLFGEENSISKISTDNHYGYYDQQTDKYYIGAVDRCFGGIYSHCGAGPVGNEWSVKFATVKNDILTVDIEVVKDENIDVYRWIFKHENYRFVLQTMNML